LNDLINHSEIRFIKQFRIEADTDYTVLDFTTDHSLSDKLGLIYEAYSKTTITTRIINSNEINKYLNITPYDKIVSHTFRQESDISVEILTWCNDDLDRETFLKELGFKFEDSPTTLFLTAVQNNSRDFSLFNINQFEEDETELIVDYLYRNEISFDLSNAALVNVLVALFKIYWSYRQDKMLSYRDGQTFGIVTSQELYDLDYTIIDQILN